MANTGNRAASEQAEICVNAVFTCFRDDECYSRWGRKARKCGGVGMLAPFAVTTDVLAQGTGVERSGLPGLFVVQALVLDRAAARKQGCRAKAY